ncbi:hypothetical protein [Altericista sp. CCNU0014]|uniref:hypothetical protein n=1 Tax=Altericista sp. CCNU0014 TaxID=3082949 RepID=UPI00384B6ECE
MTTLADRLESLKAGMVAGSTAAGAEGAIQLIQGLSHAGSSVLYGLDLGYWVDVAIAAFSGFLFGVTCRYAIRKDENPHLSSGVVLAFGLVRGLAQVHGQDLNPSIFPLVLFALLESILLFAIAYVGLSTAMRAGWIKPSL